MYQPPYYLTLAMPGQQKPNFSLTTTFQPTGDNQVLSASSPSTPTPAPRTASGWRATGSCDCSSCRVTRR